MVGAASGGGGRQLTTWGGHTRWRGARGVVEAVGEGLDRRSMTAQQRRVWRGRSGEVAKEEEKGAKRWGWLPL
jgi:hypothetical protein